MRTRKLSFVLVIASAVVIFTPSIVSSSQETPGSQPQLEISIYSFIKGTTTYVLSFALTDLLKKHSSWLRATAIATHGSGENLKTLALKPDQRKKAIAFSPTLLPYRALKGRQPFRKPWPTVRALLRWSGGTNGFATLDPRIKRPEDLRGRKIGLPRQGSDGAYFATNVLKYGWGITEKDATFQYLGWSQARDALRDGLVDAAYLLTGSSSEPPWIIPGIYQQILATKPPYFISISKETIQRAAERSGDPMSWVEAPPETYGPNQTEPVGLVELPLCYWADASLPDDVVKEILRIYTEHTGEFGNYHPVGKLIKAEKLARIPWPENLFHPAAVEFYKEKGIPIGMK